MIDLNYRKSNKILTVNIDITENAIMFAKVLLATEIEEDRHKFGEALLDELCDTSGIDVVTLKISRAKQAHKRSGNRIVVRKYGYYKPDANYIYIHNRTAARGQFLAPKTFIDTLLHEWLHHYDTKKLRLNSIHSKGFYARLKHLKLSLGIL